MLKKACLLLAMVPLVVLALFPPIDLKIPMTTSSLWPWVILCFGFLAVYTVFLKINPFIKAISIYLFINCFYSCGPRISFAAFISFTVCFYFYILCLQIDDWEPVIKVIISLIALNVIMLMVQHAGKDRLLNFGIKELSCFGTVGNPMQLRSLFVICFAFLIGYKEHRFSKMTNLILFAFIFVGLEIYFIHHNAWKNFLYARGPAWIRAIEISAQHPFVGWGIGTFKAIFPALHYSPEGAFYTLHNCWLQLLFETGYIGIALIFGFLLTTVHWLIKNRNFYCLVGLLIICVDMFVHFPTRQTQTVLIIVSYLALCEIKTRSTYARRSLSS